MNPASVTSPTGRRNADSQRSGCARSPLRFRRRLLAEVGSGLVAGARGVLANAMVVSRKRRGVRWWPLGLLWAGAFGCWADWPQLRGNPQRTAFTAETPALPLHLAWSATFAEERLGTAMEPIVAADRVFVATHAGNLYALDAATGAPQWRFTAPGPLLHSPAWAEHRVIVAAANGGVYALEAASGRLLWTAVAGPGDAGFAAAPLVADGRVYLGSRDGRFYCLDLIDGHQLWRADLSAPIRQPAAADDERVVVTAEDLVARAFQSSGPDAGRELWRQPLRGQSARDYPPMIVRGADGRRRVVLRTNPLSNFAQRLARDRAVLVRHAGADDRSWQTLDAWLKSDAARGTPELWASEQAAVRAHLLAEPAAQTFFVLDAVTGAPEPPWPVLWTGGCQGVGNPPALTADGRLLVMYRSAYGNWNLGVAPLVALGLADVATGRIEPLFHDGGRQPPWNTFWGTADEAQSFTVAGGLALLVHQGTLGGLDLGSRHLVNVHGARDTFGGRRNPPWARNEWHGPARGGVAVSDGRVFWISGSRLFCLGPTPSAGKTREWNLRAGEVPGSSAPTPDLPDLKARLRAAVAEFLEGRWAPLVVEPGLAGREFFFTHSAEAFAALAWAWPHLAGDPLQARVRDWLAAEWEQHPPFSEQGAYDLRSGPRREFQPPLDADLTREVADQPPHAFGHLPAVWLYATRVGETNRVRAAWPQLRGVFADWEKTGWRLDGARGDLYANRTFSALLALTHLAALAGDAQTAARARSHLDDAGRELAAWWERAAREGTLTSVAGVAALDRFIGGGDALSFRVRPHRHKIALFRDLTPELAAWVRMTVPDAAARVWEGFARVHQTWWLVGEERQAHFGENYLDPPDLALGAFQALAWLRGASAAELARRVDRPFCRADLFHVTKLAVALEAEQR